MSLAILGLLEDLGEFLTPSVIDLLGVALLGLLLRFLAGPAQPLAEDLAGMLDVVRDGEVTPDHLGDPLGGPEGIGPAVGGGPLTEERLLLLELLGGEPGPGTGMGPGGQPLGGGLGHLLPAVERGAADAEDAGDDGGGLALTHQFDGPGAAALQLGSSSNWSHAPTTMPAAGLFLWPNWSQ